MMTKEDFKEWISSLSEIKGWIKDADELAKSEDVEGSVIRTMPLVRTELEDFMMEHPDAITEEEAQKLHDFDMFIYKNIELAYTAFSEFYWKRSEYNPSKTDWWWWLDEYFEGKIGINPDDVWIKWEKIKENKSM